MSPVVYICLVRCQDFSMSEEKKNRIKIPLSSPVNPAPHDTIVEEEKPLEEKKGKGKKKSEVTESKKVKNSAPQPSGTSLKDRINQLIEFYKNERTQRVLGLLFILSSAYLAIALSSFIFTWQEDQDKLLGPGASFFSSETKVSNWLGKLGAMVSHLFMYKWFGISSFILVPVLLLAGLKRLFTREFIFLKKLNRIALFSIFWLSLVMGFFFTEKMLYMGGGFGYVMNERITGMLGGIGTIILYFVSFLGFMVIMYNFSFEKNKPQTDTLSPPLPLQPLQEVEETSPLNTDRTINENHIPLSEEEEQELMNIQLVSKTETEGNDFSKEEMLMQDEFKQETGQEEKETNQEEIPLEMEVNENSENRQAKKPGEVDFVVEEKKEEPVLLVEEENKAQQLVEKFGEYDPTLDLGTYQFPQLDLLENYGNIETKINQEELNGNKNKIIDTLKNYGIEIDKIKATIGPTVTLYEIVPAAGVRISKIKNLEDDIALNLAALGIRIIAPIPGKGTIGIEVPNQHPEMVPMRNILASEKFQHSNMELPIALGKTISNETFIADLAKMPHLLMAGATGQGKSVGLNAILVSLLYKKHPAQIKFVLVDPKKVELTLFNKIERHFLAKLPNSEDAIITDNTKVIHTLNSLCIEMDNRYALLQDAQVRNIKEYNSKFISRKLNPNDGHKFLPYIVLVVDEFADLIMTAGKEVEAPIARLAQLARAIGIHLIIATQRPSVNIITGTIKANFPARIAFRVTSKIDSRTILDAGGAEQLIGRGDMLLSTGNDLIRIQCAFVDTPEVEKITEFIGSQRAYPSAFLLPEYIDENAEAKEEIDLSERDKMFDDAARIIVQHQQGSASLLQRKLKLGYNRAGRIVDQLEVAGIIGPFEGSKARDVLIKDMNHLDEILNNIKNKS